MTLSIYTVDVVVYLGLNEDDNKHSTHTVISFH
jgi:hypothetical protein